MSSITELKAQLKNQPDTVEFSQLMAVITEHYQYTPVEFANGELVNAAGSNEGSCKIFAFAKKQQLSETETLSCFGHYYRDDVLKHPEAEDHANIRQFMKTGWAGISFTAEALS